MISAGTILIFTGEAFAQDPANMKWHRYSSPYDNFVEFGVPDTDMRLLRVTCDKGGIDLMGPIREAKDEDFSIGQNITINVEIGGAAQTLAAEVIEMGDGLNFLAKIKPSSLALTGLLTGQSIKIVGKAFAYVVPGKGGSALVKSAVAPCLGRRSAS